MHTTMPHSLLLAEALDQQVMESIAQVTRPLVRQIETMRLSVADQASQHEVRRGYEGEREKGGGAEADMGMVCS